MAENKAETIDELAQKLGDVHRSTVYRWVDWGLNDLNDGDGWDVEEVRSWAKEMKKARRQALRPGVDTALDDDGDTRDYQRLWRRARVIHEHLKIQKLRGELIDRAEVENMMAMRVSELTQSLDSLAAQLAPRLAPLTREPEIQGLLRKAFHKLRDHFARG